MISFLIIIFFEYAVLGMELFSYDEPHEDLYEGSVAGDFNSFPLALLALFQVLIAADWHL